MSTVKCVTRRRWFSQSGRLATGGLAITTAACDAGSGAPGADGKAAAPVTLTTASGWGDPEFLPVQERIDRTFMERHPHVTIVNDTNRQNYVPKLAAAAAAGTLPDIIKVHGTVVQEQAKQGWFVALDEYVARTRAFEPGDFLKVALDLYRVKGKLHSLPYDHGPHLLWYNRSLFDRAGVKYPSAAWKLEDLLDAARRLTNPAERVWGLSPRFAPAGNVMLQGNLLKPFGGGVVNDDETACELDTAASVQALEWWVALRTRHGTIPTADDVAGLPGGIGNVFTAGLSAMEANGSWVIPSLIQRAGFQWDVADWPSGLKGRVTASMGSGYGITRDSKARDAAWLYLSEFLGKGKDMLMQELATTGRGSPARKSFWPAFEKSPGAPANVGIIAPALEKYSVVGWPISPPAAEVNKVISTQLNRALTAQVGVADAARAAKREIDPLLAANR